MPEDLQTHIDREQTRIDAFDNTIDQKVFANGKEYTKIFIQAVDRFQTFISDSKQEILDELKHSHLP